MCSNRLAEISWCIFPLGTIGACPWKIVYTATICTATNLQIEHYKVKINKELTAIISKVLLSVLLGFKQRKERKIAINGSLYQGHRTEQVDSYDLENRIWWEHISI